MKAFFLDGVLDQMEDRQDVFCPFRLKNPMGGLKKPPVLPVGIVKEYSIFHVGPERSSISRTNLADVLNVLFPGDLFPFLSCPP